MNIYTINENFLDEWNEESAYVLGYLFAEASIYRGPNRERYEIIISGNEIATLTTVRDLLGSDHQIRPKEGTNSYQIRIGNKTLVETLAGFGLEENKTETLRYPEVPLEFEPAFVRGYFDGKGCFLIENGRRIISSFSGACESFIEDLRDHLVVLGLGRANIHQYGADDCSSVLRYYVRDTRRLYHLLYDEARVYSRDQRARYERGLE